RLQSFGGAMDFRQRPALCPGRTGGIRPLLCAGPVGIRIPVPIEPDHPAGRHRLLSAGWSVFWNDHVECHEEPKRRHSGRADGFVPAFSAAFRVPDCRPQYSGFDSLDILLFACDPLCADCSEFYSPQRGMGYVIAAVGHASATGIRLFLPECGSDAQDAVQGIGGSMPAMIRRYLALLAKEVDQLRRNRVLVIQLMLPPTIVLIIFGYALNPKVRDLRLGVVDESWTVESRNLIDSLSENVNFDVTRVF